jgi:hypothetical protein
VPDQGQGRGRIDLANLGDKIGEVILELPDIGDIAARSRDAMAANVDCIAFDPALRQREGERVDVVPAGAGRAVNDNGDRPVDGLLAG